MAKQQTYKVKEGDTLWDLSKEWGIPLKDVVSLNPQIEDPNRIFIGDKINRPEKAPSKAPPASLPSKPLPATPTPLPSQEPDLGPLGKLLELLDEKGPKDRKVGSPTIEWGPRRGSPEWYRSQPKREPAESMRNFDRDTARRGSPKSYLREGFKRDEAWMHGIDELISPERKGDPSSWWAPNSSPAYQPKPDPYLEHQKKRLRDKERYKDYPQGSSYFDPDTIDY